MQTAITNFDIKKYPAKIRYIGGVDPLDIKNTYFSIIETNPTIFILSGIPLSGKSTWAKKYCNYSWHKIKIISRDQIRMEVFKLKKYSNYKFTKNNEQFVTVIFDIELEKSISKQYDIILDNTHCKEAYIDSVIKKFEKTNYEIKVLFFDISLTKTFIRNIFRYIKSGKYIPWKVIKEMKKNYQKINKNKYNEYC